MTVAWRRPHVGDVAVLTVVSLALRIPGFDAHRLFLDDAAVAVVRRAHAFRDVLRVGVTAPGFAVVEKAVIDVAGYSVTALKIVPFAAGIAGPAVVYAVARRLSFGRWAALGAGALVAVSPVQVAMSTHVKQYTLDVVLAAVLLALGWPLLERSGAGWVQVIRFAAVAVAAALLSTPMAAVAAGVFAGAGVGMIRRRALDTRVIVSAAGWAAVVAVWVGLVVSHHTNELLRHHWNAYLVPHDQGVAEAVRVTGVRVIGAVAGLTRGYAFAVPAALLGVVWLARERVELAVALVTPVAFGVALAAARVSPFGGGGTEGRIDSYVHPILALLVVAGIERGLVHVPLVAKVLAAGIVAVALVRLPVDVRYPDQDPAPLVDTLATRARPGDAVFLHPLASFHAATDGPWPVDIRAASGSTTNFWPWIESTAPRFRMPAVCCDDPRDLVPALDSARAAPRVWVLALFDDGEPIVASLERDGYSRRGRWRSPGASLDLLERS